MALMAEYERQMTGKVMNYEVSVSRMKKDLTKPMKPTHARNASNVSGKKGSKKRGGVSPRKMGRINKKKYTEAYSRADTRETTGGKVLKKQ